MQPAPGGVRERYERALVIAVVVAVSVLLALYAYRTAPTIPVFDGWLWISLSRAIETVGFVPAMWEFGFRASEHIYVLPSLLFVALSPLLHGSFRPLTLVTAALLVVLGIFFYRVARSLGVGRLPSLLAFLVAASFRETENLLLGFQFGLALTVATGVAAMYVADRWSSARGRSAAIALALVSTLSSGAGVIALGLVIAIVVDWRRPRRVAWIALGYLVFVALVAATVYTNALQRPHFVARIVGDLQARSLARVFVDWVDIVGGGLIHGKAATAIGLLAMSAMAWSVADEVRRARRLSVLPAIVLFSLLSTFLIAWARSPVPDLSSRWSVFAAPGIAAALIALVRSDFVASLSRIRMPIGTVAVVLSIWLFANQADEALDLGKYLDGWTLRVRSSLAALAAGEPLTNDELRTAGVNPADPQSIRIIAAFYNERFPERVAAEGDVMLMTRLPDTAVPTALLALNEHGLTLTGPGQAYSQLTCPFASGCRVRLIADVTASGAATLGFIVRAASGGERNVYRELAKDGAPHVEAIATDVANGDVVQPYLFAYTRADRVDARSFGVVVSRIAAKT